MVTLGNLVDQVIGRLDQFTTNRPRLATFDGWTEDGTGARDGIKLRDVAAQQVSDTLVELGTELVYVSSFDAASGEATCPPWFRQQLGTPAEDGYEAGSRVTVAPRWPRFHVAQAVCDGIAAVYPDLFGVKTVELSTTVVSGQYDLPDEADGVLHVSIEDFGPHKTQYQVGEWTLGTNVTGGGRQLRIRPVGVGGRPLRVQYRHRPVIPDPADLDATWASTGLPESSADLPVLHAVSTLITSAEAAKTQTASVEQSERNRVVQAGTGTATSRRFEEMFRNRLLQEKRHLSALYPPRRHKTLNG